MRRAPVRNLLLAAFLFMASSAIGAQEPLRILDRSPRDVARPADIITITFDRPVTGMVEHSIDPARVVRISPPLQSRMEWRDPSTIRIVPLEPLVPGQRYAITVDTGFTALDGGRLDAPETFALAVHGAALTGTVPRLSATGLAALDPTGRVYLRFSAPVEDSVLARTVSFIIHTGSPCGPERTIRYHVARQAVPQPGDSWELRYLGYVSPNDAAARFRRIVEVDPDEPLPPSCRAVLSIPSLDSLDSPTVQYAVTTAREFGRVGIGCQRDCPIATGVGINFDAPVSPEQLVASVHFEPASAFSPKAPEAPTNSWAVTATLAPQTTYRVTIDSSLHDIYGRRMTFGFDTTFKTGDREPDFGYQAGLVFLPGNPVPVIRVRHVNVDSIALFMMPVPDSERVKQLLRASRWNDDPRIVFRDSIVRIVALHAPVNEERVSEIPLPEFGGRLLGRLVVLQTRLYTATRRPVPPQPKPPGNAPIVIVAHGLPTPKTMLQSSELLANARLSADGGIVWVTSARTGRPVHGAAVSILDTAGASFARAITDSQGMAAFTFPRPVAVAGADWTYGQYGSSLLNARVLDVRLGADRSLTDLATRSGQTLTAAELEATLDNSALTAARTTRAFVFTDRGIYRPGEQVNFGATVRDGPAGAMTAPAGDSARLQIGRWTDDGSSETVRDTVVRLSTFGTFAFAFRLKQDGALGNYPVSVSLVRGGKWQILGRTSLRVAEYRAPEFLVAASSDSVPRFRGDSVTARVTAKYLFGAPMSRSAVTWSALFTELNSNEIRIPGVGRDWNVGVQDAWWSREYASGEIRQSGVDTLDADGTARIHVGTDTAKFAGAARAEIAVSVMDLNRQTVTATTRSVVHPASFYIALRDSAQSWWWPLESPRQLRIIAVRPDGRTVAGVRVRFAVVEYRWHPQPPDANGTWSPWQMDTVRVDTVVTGETARVVPLPALHEGPVKIVATALDEKERLARTTIARYVFGRAGVAGSAPARLAVHVERDRLKPGETAVVSFRSPWLAADAWVTTEREGILTERLVRDIHGSATVRLPISERDAPNIFVSVLLLRRAELRTVDSLADHMRVGYAAIRVDDAAKRLSLQLRTARQDYSPGDSATIELTVRDSRQRKAQAEATIWAADEGVLALTGFQSPDPMRWLYQFVRDGVSYSTTLQSLPAGLPPWLWRASRRFEYGERSYNMLSQTVVSSLDGVPVQMHGAVGAATEMLPRTDFRTTAFFRSGVRTDSNGVARITVKLPDNITTFRIMAVAVGSGDRYGSAHTPLLVTKALVLRSSLPRFIRANDSVFAGAVINARDRLSRMIDVTAAGTGVTLAGNGHERTMLGAAGTEVRFAWRGTTGDSARFRIGASDGKHTDAVALSIPIKPDQAPRARTLTGMVRDSATVLFRLPRNIDPARSRLTIRTGTSPVPTLRVARDVLLAGASSCPEQLAGTGRMLVALLALERTGVKVLDDTLWAKRELQHIAAELARRYHGQAYRDCWGYSWEASPVHAAANLLLLDIRDFGVPVDTSMIRGLTATFTRLLDSLPVFPDTTYGRRVARQAAIANRLQGRLGAVAFLRRVGVLRRNDLSVLLDNASRLTWEDRVWLAELLQQFGDASNARALLNQVWASLGTAGNRVDVPDSVLTTVGFPSHIRPVARLLGATLLIEPDHPRLGALVERLTTRTRAERDEWWNTQDHVAATVALTSFALRNRGRSGTLNVQLADGSPADARRAISLVSGADTPHDTTVTLAGIAKLSGDSTEVTLKLGVTGGAQYYAVTVSEIDAERPTAPDIRGITVERWYERFDDGRTVTELREGDLVRVRLRVTAPASRDFVAVEDVLPAGLETVDLTLRTSGTLGPFTSVASEASARRRDAEAGGTSGADLYGSWYGGWWSPWGQPEQHDDRTVFFARTLWKGSFTFGYIARATTAGRFVRPQAHAEEVYNPAVNGRSEGGWFDVRPAGERKP